MALAAVAMVCLSACQVTLRVGVDVKDNGSGSVTVTAILDQQASASVPNLARDLRTSDLVKAGWRIEGPSPGPNGSVIVTASKPFSNPTEAKAVVAELSGGAGPFRSLEIVREPSLFRTTTLFRGTVDLTCGLRCFADPALQKELGGTPDLGLDPAKLEAGAGIILSRLFQFEVAVRLPGAVQSSNAPVQFGNGAKWQAKLGDKATLAATARTWNVSHIVIAVVIAVLLLAAVVVPFVYLIPRHRRRRGKFVVGGDKPSDTERKPEPVPVAVVAPEPSAVAGVGVGGAASPAKAPAAAAGRVGGVGVEAAGVPGAHSAGVGGEPATVATAPRERVAGEPSGVGAGEPLAGGAGEPAGVGGSPVVAAAPEPPGTAGSGRAGVGGPAGTAGAEPAGVAGAAGVEPAVGAPAEPAGTIGVEAAAARDPDADGATAADDPERVSGAPAPWHVREPAGSPAREPAEPSPDATAAEHRPPKPEGPGAVTPPP